LNAIGGCFMEYQREKKVIFDSFKNEYRPDYIVARG
jgi:hypothetical protein